MNLLHRVFSRTSGSRKLVPGLLTGTLALVSIAWVSYGGNLRWQPSGGFHYVPDINPAHIGAGSIWDNALQYAMSDWRDLGATSFVPGYRRGSANPANHSDNLSAIGWSGALGTGTLAITNFVYYTSSGLMVEADIEFSTRYSWADQNFDPTVIGSSRPYDFRGVARHELGHAIGFDHENATLDNMNAIYSEGCCIQHHQGSAVLPHADDKAGGRWKYPSGANQVANVMATCWGLPSGGQSSRRWCASSSYAAGGAIDVPMFLENQSTSTVFGGTSGVRVGIYLSTNSTISTFDTLIGEYYFTGNWPAGAQGPYTLNGYVPSTMVAGNYYVGVVFDNTGLVSEFTEGDNAALVDYVRVTNTPDLVVTSITPSNGSPEIGSSISALITVKNTGYDAVPATTLGLFLDSHGNAPSSVWDFDLGTATVPALAAGQSITVNPTIAIPPGLAADRSWNLSAICDFGGSISELDETNNLTSTSLYLNWPATPGYYLGALQNTIDSTTTGQLDLCSAAVGITPSPTTYYYFVWTGSGTTPGTPIPGVGTLLANVDAFTGLGFDLLGVTFMNMTGVQSTITGGDFGYVVGGSWIAPLAGYPTDFAAVYIDTATASIVGVSENTVRMNVY